MDRDLSQDAITYALKGNWDKAIETNLKLLEVNGSDIDALNRLAKAYAEKGSFKKAVSTSQKVIKIDPFNTIATKALTKWKGLKRGETYSSGPSSADTFLEEPGKTKIVSLMHLGDNKLLAKLDCGDEVKLNPHSHRASITTFDGKYVGRIPDDMSARLRQLTKYGNSYKVYIKSVTEKDVKIFIRETSRSERLKDIPSFPGEKIEYVSFTPPELVHDKEDFVADSDEE